MTSNSIQQEVMPRDAVVDWRSFAAEEIPSKGIHLPSSLFHDAFMQSTILCNNNTKNDTVDHNRKRILELGCGCGDLSIHLLQWQQQQEQQQEDDDQAIQSGELLVVGVDVNSEAIEISKSKSKMPRATTVEE